LRLELYLHGNYDIDKAYTGRQAVKQAFVYQYDLILMDINLGPDMDGIQATKEIRAFSNYKNIPIIAVTGYSTPDEKGKILSGGLNNILTKPFSKDELIMVVNSYFIRSDT